MLNLIIAESIGSMKRTWKDDSDSGSDYEDKDVSSYVGYESSWWSSIWRKRSKPNPIAMFGRPEYLELIRQHEYPVCWLVSGFRYLQFHPEISATGSWIYLMTAWYWEMSIRFIDMVITLLPQWKYKIINNDSKLIERIRDPIYGFGSLLDFKYLVRKYGLGRSGGSLSIPAELFHRELTIRLHELLPKEHHRPLRRSQALETATKLRESIRTYLLDTFKVSTFPEEQSMISPKIETVISNLIDIESNPQHSYGKIYPLIGQFQTSKYLNLDPKSILEIALSQIQLGIPVPFTVDGFNLNQALTHPNGMIAQSTLQWSRSDRYRYGQINIDHEVILTGVRFDKFGAPREWEVLNSWGEVPGWVSDSWLERNIEGIGVDRSQIPTRFRSLISGIEKI